MINTYRKKFNPVLVAFMLLGAISGCEDNGNGSPVLASVNGAPIYKSELDANVISMFGAEQASALGEMERKNVLESMVMSMLIHQQAEKELPEDVLHRADVQADIYREKILVNHYLKTVIKPAIIPDAVVSEYYKKHLDEFGGGKVKQYNVLTTSKPLSSNERDELLSDFSGMDKQQVLTRIYETLKKKGFDVLMLKGILDNESMDKRLYQIIDRLEMNENSNITFIDNKPYIARVTHIKNNNARPLSEVASQIREKLKSVYLKEHIKTKTDKLKEKADIKYLKHGS